MSESDLFEKNMNFFSYDEDNVTLIIPFNIYSNEEDPYQNDTNKIKENEINNDNTKTKKSSKKALFSAKKKVLGRKRKNSQIKGKHNKHSGDNVIRKIKSRMIKNVINLINKLINNIYNGKIGYGPFIKKILPLNQNQIVKSKYDKVFINKTLKEILSDNITGKFYHYCPEHNKNLIESLLKENNHEKRSIFEKIFNLTYIDCLKHYRGEIKLPILEGLETLKETCADIMKNDKDEEYIKTFKYYVNNFENTIRKKREKK